MVFYSSCTDYHGFSAREILEKRLRNINEACGKMISDCFVEMIRSRIVEEGDSAWVAAAIVLKPNSRDV
jgi:hypothetical protein